MLWLWLAPLWWFKWCCKWLMLMWLLLFVECKLLLLLWCKLLATLPPPMLVVFPMCKICGCPFKLFVIEFVCCCNVEPIAAARAVSSPVVLVVQSDIPYKLWIHFDYTLFFFFTLVLSHTKSYLKHIYICMYGTKREQPMKKKKNNRKSVRVKGKREE